MDRARPPILRLTTVTLAVGLTTVLLSSYIARVFVFGRAKVLLGTRTIDDLRAVGADGTLLGAIQKRLDKAKAEEVAAAGAAAAAATEAAAATSEWKSESLELDLEPGLAPLLPISVQRSQQQHL